MFDSWHPNYNPGILEVVSLNSKSVIWHNSLFVKNADVYSECTTIPPDPYSVF